MGGVQCGLHFDWSSHDAFLKCIQSSTQALRESSTAPVAHMNPKTLHPKACAEPLLHPAPRRPVKVCRSKSNADAPFGQCTSGRWRSLARPHCFEDKSDRSPSIIMRNIENEAWEVTCSPPSWDLRVGLGHSPIEPRPSHTRTCSRSPAHAAFESRAGRRCGASSSRSMAPALRSWPRHACAPP